MVLREGKTVTERALQDFANGKLAAFKVPRYLAYVAGDFPRTPTRKIIKRMLVEESTDLREGAFDRVDDVWR